MEARVLSFPAGRSVRSAPDFAGSAIAPSPADEPQAECVTELTLELRRVVHTGSPLSTEAEAAARDRCVRMSLKVIAGYGGVLRLEGTPEHPVVEARFSGEQGSNAAVRAAQQAGEAVRKAGGNEFVASTSVASGTAVEGVTGVRVVFGAPEVMTARLREIAAPGQILLGGPSWGSLSLVDVRPGQSLALVSGAAPVQVFVLHDVR